MDSAQIAELLQPFLVDGELSPRVLESLRLYLELLVRWNARVNLTAIRDPEQIVTRHFGESVFAAQVLRRETQAGSSLPVAVADVGSGAGFPGIPIKLFIPDAELTLIESQNKKATFLREVLRALALERAHVFCGRAEAWSGVADVITIRAVERFERVLPVAAGLVAEAGRLCLLIGAGQFDIARNTLAPHWRFSEPAPIPLSDARVVAIAQRDGSKLNR